MSKVPFIGCPEFAKWDFYLRNMPKLLFMGCHEFASEDLLLQKGCLFNLAFCPRPPFYSLGPFIRYFRVVDPHLNMQCTQRFFLSEIKKMTQRMGEMLMLKEKAWPRESHANKTLSGYPPKCEFSKNITPDASLTLDCETCNSQIVKWMGKSADAT